MPRRRPRQSGISLIEALVALAVMGFGILGVLGMQASLRMNGDIAKQRSEAVRISQETLETARAYADMGAFDDIVTTTDTTVDVDRYPFANASYLVRTQVSPIPPVDENEPRLKNMVVTVSWTDRTGQSQNLSLASSVHAVPPALPGSLALPGNTGPVRRPGGRHFAIPPDAVLQEDSPTSIFTPPGADSVRWVFDNGTGMITSICMPAESCTAASAFLLTGYVRFAPEAVGQPLPSHAENPTGEVLPIQVEVAQTAPLATTVACYEQIGIGALRYFCAIPVGTVLPLQWSGRSSLAGLTLATDAADESDTKYRVCRYTPVRGCHEVVGPLPPPEEGDLPYPPEADSKIWGMPGAPAACTEPNPQTDPPTPSRILRNSDHPLDYDKVREALINQNFLVIRAGNGSDAFECPGDDESTPYVNGNTWRHQPHE